MFSVGTEINRTEMNIFRGNPVKHLPTSSSTKSDKKAHGSLRILNHSFAYNHNSLRIPLLVPRAHVPFGQHQDTELWNNQFPEIHSRPQRPRSFWSAPRIATSGLVQRHFVFEWLCKHNRLRPEPIRFVKLDSEHAQSDGKSVNRGLPVLDLTRGRDSWC